MSYRKRDAGIWEDMADHPSTKRGNPSTDAEDAEEVDAIEPVPDRPFANNATPELLGLYRSLMKLSKLGPLTSQPARLLVRLIQELIQRGERI